MKCERIKGKTENGLTNVNKNIIIDIGGKIMEILAFIIGLSSAFFAELIPVSVMNAFDISDAMAHLPIFSTITFILALSSIILGIVAIVNKSKNEENKSEYKSFSIMGMVISIFSIAIVLLFTYKLFFQNNDNKIDEMISQKVEEYFDVDYEYEEEYEEDYDQSEVDEVEEVENEDTVAE